MTPLFLLCDVRLLNMYLIVVLTFCFILDINDSDKGNLINGFAFTAKLCVSCGWASLMLLTSESYPTVVR